MNGQLTAGRLPVGGLYLRDLGVMFEVGPGGEKGPITGPQPGLRLDPASAVLDGVEVFAEEAVLGAVELTHGLIHEPEATLTGLVHMVGTLPEQAVALAFEAPEMLRTFQRLPPEEQLRIAGQILASAALVLRAARAAGAAGQAMKGPPGGLKIRVGLADLGAGRTLPWLEVDGLAVPAGAASGGGAALGLGGVILRSRRGDGDDPKVRFANAHHIHRTYGDPRELKPELREAVRDLEQVAGAHENTQLEYARMMRAHLETLDGVLAPDLVPIHRAAQGLAAPARAELQGWIQARFRRAIEDVHAEGLGSRETTARLDDLRRFGKRAGVDVDATARAVRDDLARGQRILRYEPSPKHGIHPHHNASPGPSRGQWALDRSLEQPGFTTRRVAVDPEFDEIIVFDEHVDGRFHGHVRPWSGKDCLEPALQAALRKAGLVTKNGKIK